MKRTLKRKFDYLSEVFMAVLVNETFLVIRYVSWLKVLDVSGTVSVLVVSIWSLILTGMYPLECDYL
jgi:hypothetical protein